MTVLGPSWAALGASWANRRSSWAVLGPSMAVLGQSWKLLGRLGRSGSRKRRDRRNPSKANGKSLIWASSGSPGGPLGNLLELFGFWGLLSRLEAILGGRGAILGRLGGILKNLETSSILLGRLGNNIGPCGVQLGGQLVRLGKPFWPSWKPS